MIRRPPGSTRTDTLFPHTSLFRARVRIGELKMDIVAIVSNHPRGSLSLGMIDGIPYHYLPVAKDSKPQQEARIKALVEETGATLIVLARYMQILSDDLAAYLSGRCINIHHSFLDRKTTRLNSS